MLYYVSLNGRTFRIELVDGSISIDGEAVGDAELMAAPGTAVHHLLVGGRSHTMVARPAGRGMWELHLDGVRHIAEVIDERTRTIRDLARSPAAVVGPAPLRAPMPGLIVRVAVEPGDAVNAGQGVVIMEAMKMENELHSERAGVVARVLVAAGEPVEKGAVLIEFSEASGEP
jgi:pyruvate carboxylase subunit B